MLKHDEFYSSFTHILFSVCSLTCLAVSFYIFTGRTINLNHDLGNIFMHVSVQHITQF